MCAMSYQADQTWTLLCASNGCKIPTSPAACSIELRLTGEKNWGKTTSHLKPGKEVLLYKPLDVNWNKLKLDNTSILCIKGTTTVASTFQ